MVLRQASLGVSALVKVAETPAEKVAIAAQLRLVDSGPLGLLPVLRRKDLQPGWRDRLTLVVGVLTVGSSRRHLADIECSYGHGEPSTESCAMPDPRPVPSRRLRRAERRLGGLDHDEFAHLVVETQPLLTSLALRLTRNSHDACDIVQEAYLRAWRARADFRRDAEPSTWLWTIVRNAAYTHTARRRSWESLDDLPHEVAGAVSGGEPEAASEQAALRSQLLGAIDRLPARLRSVVVLKDLTGLPHRDVARQLDVSVPAVRVRLHRAHRWLHEVLREPQVAADAAA